MPRELRKCISFPVIVEYKIRRQTYIMSFVKVANPGLLQMNTLFAIILNVDYIL
jgi:hypothetical protein